MNRIILLSVFIIGCSTICKGQSTTENIIKTDSTLRNWDSKYRASLNPCTIKYTRANKRLDVFYCPQTVVDTIAIIDTLQRVRKSVSGGKEDTTYITQIVKFQRRMKVQTHREYTPGLARQWDTVIAHNTEYYHISPVHGLIPVIINNGRIRYNYSDMNIGSGRWTHDSLSWDWNGERTGSGDTVTPDSVVFTALTITDTLLSVREIKNKMIGDLDPNNFYFGLFYTPAIAYRSIAVNDPLFADVTMLNSRDVAETIRYGHTASIQIGYNFGKHTVYGEFLNLWQGFNSNKQAINWETGLSQSDTLRRKYEIVSNGLGIGYSYSSYNNLINPIIDLGLYFNFFQVHYRDTAVFTAKANEWYSGSQVRDIGLRKNTLGAKAGLGLSIRPGYRTEIRIMPQIFYNFTSANDGVLNTHFYNFGLNTGIAFRL